MNLVYGSICSGIEAVSLAWEPLGMRPAWFAEIDPFCNAVLAHHWPAVPNLGDITQDDFIEKAKKCGHIDILVGGTPCQSFSTAGRRRGFADHRGNLTLQFFAIAETIRPAWIVWENVPGLLTQDRGRAFGTILGKVAELGYGWTYRILDAQYLGVPQRRRRVFVVGHLGSKCSPEILIEPEGEGRHSSACEEAEENASRVAPTSSRILTVGLASDVLFTDDGIAQPVTGRNGDPGVVVYQCHGNNIGPMGTLRAGDGGLTSGVPFVAYLEESSYVVRRFTPRECERLQGFPDDHTLITYRGKIATDTRRYKAVGNSMAVPVMRWIGKRLLAAHSVSQSI